MLKISVMVAMLGCLVWSVEAAEKVKLKDEGEVKFDPMNSSEEEVLLFQDLAKRAQELNAREEVLNKRSLLVTAAEASLGEKLKHFDLLKKDLLEMLDKLKEKDDKQMNDLVKIYVSMKPKLAANVLNIMEMQTLKELVKRMDKRKAAPILAAMDKTKVKALSEILAKEYQRIS